MPARHHMNVRCMRLRLCCVALGRCCHGALVQNQAFLSGPMHCTCRASAFLLSIFCPGPHPTPRLCGRGGGGFWIRGCAAALLASKGPSMCRSSEDHVPSLGETQGHTRTSRARVCVYSSCPPPPLSLRCGRRGGGFRTEGMRLAKQPDAFTPPPLPPLRRPRRVFVTAATSSHAPCACPPGTSALLSCCGGTRYPPPPPPPPPKHCRVHRSVLWHHKY